MNHFLLLSSSFEKWLLVELFFYYSTRSSCIVLLSSLVEIFRENLLGWKQLSRGNYPWGGGGGGNHSGAGRQFSSGTIVLEPILSLEKPTSKVKNLLSGKTYTQITEVYLELSRTFTMELFCKNS